MEIDPYNPLDLAALGESLLRHLERMPALPLDTVERFVGSGIYALYYHGASPPYAEIGRLNQSRDCVLPLYVGRAKDQGSRTGANPMSPVEGSALWDRVREHRRSIKNAENLEVAEFSVRMLVVLPLWIPLAESMVIQRYRPLWNAELQGFGIHAPGGGRLGQARSHWDILHPGRGFAATLTGSQSATRESLLERIVQLGRQAVESFSSRLP